jgi:hypothetical protein
VPLGKSGRTSEKHGLFLMKRAVRELGDRALDGRTSVAKVLAEWKAELIDDLGGREAISTQQLAIIDLAVKTKLILDSVDAWVLTRSSIVDKRRRALLPIVRERQQLADALSRYLQVLGLERRAKPAIDLQSYVAARYGAEQRAQEASGARDESRLDDSDSGESNHAIADEEELDRHKNPAPSGRYIPAREAATSGGEESGGVGDDGHSESYA